MSPVPCSASLIVSYPPQLLIYSLPISDLPNRLYHLSILPLAYTLKYQIYCHLVHIFIPTIFLVCLQVTKQVPGIGKISISTAINLHSTIYPISLTLPSLMSFCDEQGTARGALSTYLPVSQFVLYLHCLQYLLSKQMSFLS